MSGRRSQCSVEREGSREWLCIAMAFRYKRASCIHVVGSDCAAVPQFCSFAGLSYPSATAPLMAISSSRSLNRVRLLSSASILSVTFQPPSCTCYPPLSVLTMTSILVESNPLSTRCQRKLSVQLRASPVQEAFLSRPTLDWVVQYGCLPVDPATWHPFRPNTKELPCPRCQDFQAPQQLMFVHNKWQKKKVQPLWLPDLLPSTHSESSPRSSAMRSGANVFPGGLSRLTGPMTILS